MSEMTKLEQLEAEAAAESEFRDTVQSGLAPIRQAKQRAQDDIDAAEGFKQDAQDLTAELQTLKGQIDGFTPSATYSPQQMNQMKNMLSQVVAAQIKVGQALAEGYGHRKEDDQNAVVVNRSMEYLSKYIFGELGST